MKYYYNSSVLSVILCICQVAFGQTPKKQKELSQEALQTWWHKDLGTDTIPGISLDKAYKELLQNKTADTVIVAVLDTGVDRYHEDLRAHIWTNPKEILDNGIDDDNNGYIDDVHGWNFEVV